MLGDEASAHVVGKAALGMTLKSIDRQCPASPLAERGLSRCEGAEGIVGIAGSPGPSEFGTSAPITTGFARQGDVLADYIVRGGAQDNSAMLRVIGRSNGRPVCLTGGIAARCAPLRPVDMQSDLTPPPDEPLAGALLRAAEFARESPA